jgi:hypothetical protein
MRRRHECGHFLVADLHELDLSLGAVQRAEYAVDPVARIAVDAAHAPCVQPFNDEVTDGLAHCNLPMLCSQASGDIVKDSIGEEKLHTAYAPDVSDLRTDRSLLHSHLGKQPHGVR